MSALTEKHSQWLEEVISQRPEEASEDQEPRLEAREILNWALGKLSAGDRMVLELIYLEGLSVQKSAELLGWSKTNVKVRSFRARTKLEKLLSKVKDQGRRGR
jgi:RNA polymerase sigma-70 factor (ECF subfamily)